MCVCGLSRTLADEKVIDAIWRVGWAELSPRVERPRHVTHQNNAKMILRTHTHTIDCCWWGLAAAACARVCVCTSLNARLKSKTQTLRSDESSPMERRSLRKSAARNVTITDSRCGRLYQAHDRRIGRKLILLRAGKKTHRWVLVCVCAI